MKCSREFCGGYLLKDGDRRVCNLCGRSNEVPSNLPLVNENTLTYHRRPRGRAAGLQKTAAEREERRIIKNEYNRERYAIYGVKSRNAHKVS